jgi:hypothetical protein
MAVRPSSGAHLVLKGEFKFTATSADYGDITDRFSLRIEVPEEFPKALPRVIETDRRVPRNGDYHVNGDGTLCLGSPLRLLLKVSKAPTLCGFAEKCLVPYLFAVSHKLENGGPMLFDELAHGAPGELQDYVDLFALKRPEQARRALEMLAMKKRRANRLLCPCGCGKRLGRCRFNFKLREFRNLASRTWFRSQLR